MARSYCKAADANVDANRGNTGQYCSDWQEYKMKRFGLFMRITQAVKHKAAFTFTN